MEHNDFFIENRPTVAKHLQSREKDSLCAKRRFTAPVDKCGLKLGSVIGYNGKHSAENIIWIPSKEFFAFSIGTLVCVENLKTGEQKILCSHQEDVTSLCNKSDLTQLASASAYLLNMVATSISSETNNQLPKCQITIWDSARMEIAVNLFHKNASNITCLKYSTDDRFLVSISDYKCPSLSVWKACDDYENLIFIDCLNYVIHDVAWNPFKINEFIMCGQNKSLVVCAIDEKKKVGSSFGQLKFSELDVPLAVSEVYILIFFNH